MELKNLIKIKRLEKHLSTTKLAEMVGVSHSTVIRWEHGDIATMKQSKILALAKALGITPADILDMPSIEHVTFQEQQMLDLLRQLSPTDQEEIKALIEYKLSKYQ